MNFQERFKGKTSQVSKDLVASITDTADRMKVDFHNMKPCDVFEISRSYTPTVKSEIGAPTRSSTITFNNTDKGAFARQQKSMSQKLITNTDQVNNGGNSELHHSIFSVLQNNFDNTEVISDLVSPVHLKRQSNSKIMEKSKFQDSPVKIKQSNPQFALMENIPTSPVKIDAKLLPSKGSLQSPQQILQARLAKERSQSNNFQRVGSYLAKSQQTEPSLKEKGVEIIILRNNTPSFTVKPMQVEDGDNMMKNLAQLEQNIQNKNSFRQKNIEKNIITTSKSVIKQMTEHGYSLNSDGVTYTMESDKFSQSISPTKLSSSINIHQQKPSIQMLWNQADEYYAQSNNLGDMQTSLQLNSNSQSSNSTRKIKSHIILNDKQSSSIQANGKLQEDLEQFINGLNRNPTSGSQSFLTQNKPLSSQSLWMNNQFAQMIPANSLQSQINQIQMKREEEEALMQYKNQFNYRKKNGKPGIGCDSPALSNHGMDSPSVYHKRAPDTFQQISDECNNNTSNIFPSQSQSLQSTINNNVSQMQNSSGHRQKSFSSQNYPLNLSKVPMNIK